MKKLEELGISPAPWNVKKESSGYYIANAEDTGVASLVRYYSNLECIKADARLIAAAPELYDALHDVVAYCESTHLVPSERFGKVLEKAKSALAKAAGEEVADGK